MQTKLTLRLDDALISSAKEHAARSGRSVSGLVADFFALIEAADAREQVAVTPRVRRLRGVLADSGLDEDDHRRHLEQKHA